MSDSWRIRQPGPLRGTVTLPGDKSVSHRAFLLNALAHGVAEVRGANLGADVASTRECLRALGVRIQSRADRWVVHGQGARWRPAADALDCGNSGTTMRLLAGALAAQPFTATLDGDESLRRRPMERIAVPLRRMGARVEGPSNGAHPPLIVTGASLKPGRFELPVASAQVKSCLLLAAAAGGVGVEIEEPGASRDHTERMLASMGASIDFSPGRANLRAGAPLAAKDVEVGADPSAAALFAACALAVPGSSLRFPGVLKSKSREGWVEVARRMGAILEWENPRATGGETLADLVLSPSGPLRATEVGPAEIPSLVDEVPALAVLAALAEGTTVFDGVAELRVKESDRVASLETLLACFGIECGSEEERLWVRGGKPRGHSSVPATDDHRMAMAAAALARAAAGREPRAEFRVDVSAAEVSFPGFARAVEDVEDAG